jgi:hypothetical protein
MASGDWVLGWSASIAIRMAKRYGHIRPDAQCQALESSGTGLPSRKTPVLEVCVHQNANQLPLVPNRGSELTN